MDNIESIAKAAMEKMKEMNMVENTKEIINQSTPFVTKFMKISSDWLFENTKVIIVKSCNWLTKTAPQVIYTGKNLIEKAPISYTISIGVVLFLFLRWCCGGRGSGGNGKMMKAPGRNNIRIHRSKFESSPKAYFRDLRSKK